MSYAPTTHDGNGSTDTFAIGFDYISIDHLSVSVDGAATGAWELASPSTIQFTTPPPSGTGNIVIERETPADALLVDFADGSSVSEENLDKINKQWLFVLEEYIYAAPGSRARYDKASDSTGMQTGASGYYAIPELTGLAFPGLPDGVKKYRVSILVSGASGCITLGGYLGPLGTISDPPLLVLYPETHTRTYFKIHEFEVTPDFGDELTLAIFFATPVNDTVYGNDPTAAKFSYVEINEVVA